MFKQSVFVLKIEKNEYLKYYKIFNKEKKNQAVLS